MILVRYSRSYQDFLAGSCIHLQTANITLPTSSKLVHHLIRHVTTRPSRLQGRNILWAVCWKHIV